MINQPGEEREIAVGGLAARYLVAGAGPPLVLLHGNGDSRRSWSWVGPRLARSHRTYALDLPGFAEGWATPADFAPARLARFVAGFLDALALDRAALVGNSLGGLVALHLALARPGRVAALGLVDSAGLGYCVSPLAAALAWPGAGEAALGWGRTPLGAWQRGWVRQTLLFARPARVPAAWHAEQERLGRLPGFPEAVVAALRAVTTWGGQREVLLGQLRRLALPALVLWGAHDAIFPAWQAHAARALLPRGHLAILPDCGHLPHVERPDETAAALGAFLGEAGPR